MSATEITRSRSIGGPQGSPNGPRELTFRPVPKQEQFMKDTAAEILMSGTVGAGKSKIGCEKGYWLNLKYPGNRGLIVRKYFSDVLASTINQTLLEDVIPRSHIVDHNKGEHYLVHETGATDPSGDPVHSEIHYHGLDSGEKSVDALPKKIMSHAYGWIFVDEGTELNQDEWTALLTRLRFDGRQQNGYYYPVPEESQQIFTATNPAPPTHFMYERFMGSDPIADSSVYRMTLHENPGASDDYVNRMETQLSGIHYERLVEGKWKGAEGMVYEEYDPLVHLLHPDDLPAGWTIDRHSEFAATGEKCYWVSPPPDWQIYRAIDFGYTNPFVCQWWAKSPDDTLILFREIYRSQTRYEKQAEDIVDWTPRRVVKSFADHDAEGRETLNRAGVNTVNADKSVEDGIQAVKSRLALDDRNQADLYFMEGARVHRPDPALLLDGDGTPLKTVDEIASYRWDEDSKDEEPIKEYDHGMDAMRYLVYSLDGGINITSDEIERVKQIAEGFSNGKRQPSQSLW